MPKCRLSVFRVAVLPSVDGQNPALLLSILNYGNYGIFLIMGSAGFCPSTVLLENPEVEARVWRSDWGWWAERFRV